MYEGSIPCMFNQKMSGEIKPMEYPQLVKGPLPRNLPVPEPTVIVKSKQGTQQAEKVDKKDDVAVIPNIATHSVNRTVDDIAKGVSSTDPESGIRSKELKSLLQLSKEANLDTNITHKRNALTPDPKRSMRSQNPDFAAKQQSFLSKVAQGHVDSLSDKDEKVDRDDGGGKKRRRESSTEPLIGGAIDSKNKKLLKSAMELVQKNKDGFCWRCHRDGVTVSCTTCPRSYHTKCLRNATGSEHWICPECSSILTAESVKTRSPALRNMPLGHLCKLLKFALKRMVQISDSDPFLAPVDEKEFPDYKSYIVQPMDFTKLEKNIKANLYGSTKAFEADAKWLLHNSIIFNSYQSKLTTIAKSIIKVCKQEMAEIENCSTCYLNANTKKSWFVEVCPKPHLLVWAKLKGFPYWPAKVMCTNNQGLVDVRFFGAHDRAWVSVKECFLYSIKDPNMNHYKRDEINECIREVDVYIQKLKSIYGRFNYPPFKTPYDSEHELEQLQMLLPDYKSDAKKDSEVTSPTKFVQNKEEASDEEEDWEVRKYIEEGRTKKSTSPQPVRKQRVRASKTPTQKRYAKTPVSEEMLHENKKSRRSSIQSSQSDSSRFSGSSEKVTKADSIESENSKDSSVFDDKKNTEGTKDALVLPPGKLKMADKLMKKLAGSDEKQTTETERVVITSFENSPGKSIVESENESDNDIPTLNDIKQVILGNASLDDDIKTAAKANKSEKNKENYRLSKKNEVEKTSIFALKNKENVELQPSKILEKKSKENTEIVQKENPVVITEMDKEELEHKKDKPHLKPKLKSVIKPKDNIEIKPVDTNPIQLCHTDINTKDVDEQSQISSQSDEEDSSIEDEESLLEEMYFEVVEEQRQRETGMKNINGAMKRKRISGIRELESPIHNKMVKLVDIDLIKNAKLHPLETLGNTLPAPLEKEKLASPNMFDGEVEIKYELESDEDSLTSENYIEELPSIMCNQVPEKNVMPEKNEMSVTLLRQPLNNSQKPAQTSLLKPQKPQKSTSSLIGSLATVTTAPTTTGTTKITTSTGIDSGGVMILAQPKAFLNNQIVLPPNQSITYGGNSIFVQHPQFSNYLIPTTALNVSSISLPASTVPNQVEPQNPVKVTQTQVSLNVIVPKSIQSTVVSSLKTPTQSVSPVAKSITSTVITKSQNVMISKPVLVNTSSIKQVVAPIKSSGVPSNKAQSSTITNTTTTKTVLSSTSAKLTSNISSPPPKIVTKQLPALRRANQIPLSPQITLITLSNTTTSNTTVTASTCSTAVSTVDTTTLPPLHNLVTSSAPIVTSQAAAVSTPCVTTSSAITSQPSQPVASIAGTSKVDSMEDYNFLTGHVPDRLVKALCEVTSRPPPPLLIPKPSGPLTANLDQGVSSSAGPVAAKVNSIAHKLTDYFRGMLVEFLSEFTTQDSSEAAIAALKLEIENLKQTHSLDVFELKKNLQTILREMQKNFSEERQRIIEETRKTCELEAIKRVDEAKSKQWCSNCMKEAQFYCCWNTSYCDYPCQMEHWPAHMERCSQKTDGNGNAKPNFVKRTPLAKVLPGCNLQPKKVKKCFVPSCLNSEENSAKLFLVVPRDEVRRRRWLEKVCRPYVKTGCLYCCEDHFNTSILSPAKNHKVYTSPKTSAQTKPTTSGVKSTNSTNTITIVQQTPGNYELAGSGPIAVAGKLFHNLNTLLTSSGSPKIFLSPTQQRVEAASSTTSEPE